MRDENSSGHEPIVAVEAAEADGGCCVCEKLDVFPLGDVFVVEEKDAVPGG